MVAQRPPTFLTGPETAGPGVRLAQVLDLAEPAAPVDLIEPESGVVAADDETADTTPSTADAVIVEEDVTAAAAESPSESSVAPLIKVEATDEEAAELSAEPADYSVYPAGAGAEIAAATDELALAA